MERLAHTFAKSIVFRPGAWWIAAVLVAASGCGGSVSLYDATAYKQATDLKAEALTLVEQADGPVDEYRADVAALRLNLRKALEYERGRAENQITTRMWEILVDPDRNLLGGFLRRWEESGRLGSAFIDEAAGQIGAAFDQIIALEAEKIDPEEVDRGIFPGL